MNGTHHYVVLSMLFSVSACFQQNYIYLFQPIFLAKIVTVVSTINLVVGFIPEAFFYFNPRKEKPLALPSLGQISTIF